MSLGLQAEDGGAQGRVCRRNGHCGQVAWNPGCSALRGPATRLPALLQGRPAPGRRVQGCPATRVSLCCRVFETCHAMIPPGPYYQGCVFDQCHMAARSDVVCSSLELYASLCAANGVCVDWRRQTNHTCRECPLGVGFLGEEADPKAERTRFLERTEGPWAGAQGGWALTGWAGLCRACRRGAQGVSCRLQDPPAGVWCSAATWGLEHSLGVAPGWRSSLRLASPSTQPSPARLTRCIGPVAPPTPPPATAATAPALCKCCPLSQTPEPLRGPPPPWRAQGPGQPSAPHRALEDAGPVTEGCFCPEDMTLFSTSMDICVPAGCPSMSHGHPGLGLVGCSFHPNAFSAGPRRFQLWGPRVLP